MHYYYTPAQEFLNIFHLFNRLIYIILLEKSYQSHTICILKSLKLELWNIKSLIYSENNTGDMTHPWGAPVLTMHSSDSWPLYHTLWVRDNKTSLIHKTRHLLTPKDINRSNKISTLIVLNADVKSKNKILAYEFEFCKWQITKITKVNTASSVPLFRLYAKDQYLNQQMTLDVWQESFP